MLASIQSNGPFREPPGRSLWTASRRKSPNPLPHARRHHALLHARHARLPPIHYPGRMIAHGPHSAHSIFTLIVGALGPVKVPTDPAGKHVVSEPHVIV